jgi:hypothetical protein
MASIISRVFIGSLLAARIWAAASMALSFLGFGAALALLAFFLAGCSSPLVESMASRLASIALSASAVAFFVDLGARALVDLGWLSSRTWFVSWTKAFLVLVRTSHDEHSYLGSRRTSSELGKKFRESLPLNRGEMP